MCFLQMSLYFVDQSNLQKPFVELDHSLLGWEYSHIQNNVENIIAIFSLRSRAEAMKQRQRNALATYIQKASPKRGGR